MSIGLGFLSTAHIHAAGWLREAAAPGSGFVVRAVWDEVPTRGRALAKEVGATFYDQASALIADPAIQAVVIAAENTRHLPLLIMALESGRPVLCEKPLVTTDADAAVLEALIARTPGPLISGYVYPFQGVHRAIAGLLRQGALGQVTHASYRNAHHGAWAGWFGHSDLAWFHDTALAGGGGLLDEGTHAVHILSGLFGPVDAVWAMAGCLSGRYPSADDFGIIHLRFRSGVIGTAEASWIHTGGPTGLEVIGSTGAIHRTDSGYRLVRPDHQAVPILPAAETPWGVARLGAAIRGELEPGSVAADNAASLAAVRIMAAAYRSVSSGSWIRLREA